MRYCKQPIATVGGTVVLCDLTLDINGCCVGHGYVGRSEAVTPPGACERCEKLTKEHVELVRYWRGFHRAIAKAIGSPYNETAVTLETAQALRSLIHELSISGVEHDDPRLRYVTVQIDRETWNELQRVVGTRRAT